MDRELAVIGRTCIDIPTDTSRSRVNENAVEPCSGKRPARQIRQTNLNRTEQFGCHSHFFPTGHRSIKDGLHLSNCNGCNRSVVRPATFALQVLSDARTCGIELKSIAAGFDPATAVGILDVINKQSTLFAIDRLGHSCDTVADLFDVRLDGEI